MEVFFVYCVEKCIVVAVSRQIVVGTGKGYVIAVEIDLHRVVKGKDIKPMISAFPDIQEEQEKELQEKITNIMIIMNLIFVCAGFAAPFSYSTFGHCFLIADIAVANLFIHYDNLDMMYMFNIPAVIAVCVMHNMVQRVYFEQYVTKDKLEKLVVRDQLTDMINRNKMKEISDVATGELDFAKDLNVSMLLIDIDYFKKVNDTYGHASGDYVLKTLLANVKEHFKEYNASIGRWGGEEFLFTFEGMNVQQAYAALELLRFQIEKYNFQHKEQNIKVTMINPRKMVFAPKNADDQARFKII